MSGQTKGGFWTSTGAMVYEPKLQNRFRVIIEGMGLEDDTGGDDYHDSQLDSQTAWYVKSCEKPQIKIGVMERGELYAGEKLEAARIEDIPQWEVPLTMTFVDPSYPNVTRKLMRMFRRAGYLDLTATEIITNVEQDNSVFDFTAFKKAVGKVKIQQLDANGIPLETWELHGAWPMSVNFGKLDYGSDDLVEITVGFYYAAAFLTTHGEGNDLAPRESGEAMQKSQGADGQMSERSFTYQKDTETLSSQLDNPGNTTVVR